MDNRHRLVQVLDYIDSQIQIRPDAWNQDIVARPSEEGLVGCLAGYTIMLHDPWLFRAWEVSIPPTVDWTNPMDRTNCSLGVFTFKTRNMLIEDHAAHLLGLDPSQCWEIFSHNEDIWYSYKEFIGKPEGDRLNFTEYCQLVARLTGVEYTPQR